MTLLIIGLIFFFFAVVILVGAPYLPTRRKYINQALDILDLKPGQTFVDLGCGDGSTLLHAARRGLNAVGYEINPFLALIAWLRTRHYSSKVRVVWGDMWQQPLPATVDGIYIFLIDRHMKKMEKKLNKQAEDVKVVSYGFKFPHKTIRRRIGPFFCLQVLTASVAAAQINV